MSDENTRWIKCVDCGTEFAFESGEQKFYADKGYPEPKRCKEHRKAARERHKKREEELKNPGLARERREASPFHPKNWERPQYKNDHETLGI